MQLQARPLQTPPPQVVLKCRSFGCIVSGAAAGCILLEPWPCPTSGESCVCDRKLRVNNWMSACMKWCLSQKVPGQAPAFPLAPAQPSMLAPQIQEAPMCCNA
eukprot:4303086-Amphidinium_carterae.1